MNCIIRRDRNWLNNNLMNPRYDLYYGDKYIMSGKKQTNNRFSTYHLCLGRDMQSGNNKYIGKIKSNFIGT